MESRRNLNGKKMKRDSIRAKKEKSEIKESWRKTAEVRDRRRRQDRVVVEELIVDSMSWKHMLEMKRVRMEFGRMVVADVRRKAVEMNKLKRVRAEELKRVEAEELRETEERKMMMLMNPSTLYKYVTDKINRVEREASAVRYENYLKEAVYLAREEEDEEEKDTWLDGWEPYVGQRGGKWNGTGRGNKRINSLPKYGSAAPVKEVEGIYLCYNLSEEFLHDMAKSYIEFTHFLNGTGPLVDDGCDIKQLFRLQLVFDKHLSHHFIEWMNVHYYEAGKEFNEG
jgi:hypothetical protein